MRLLALFALLLTFACGGTATPAGTSSEAPDTAKPAAREASAQPQTRDDAEPSPDAARAGCAPTGCSGQICAELGSEIMTTCEFRPEYVCYRAAVCERQADGECGFTDTPELRACLANPPAE